MAVKANELANAASSRLTAEIIVQDYQARVGFQNVLDWHSDILNVDQIYRGELAVEFTDGSVSITDPMVQNVVQTSADDVARLCTESTATVVVRPKKDTQSEIDRARIAQNIRQTWWDAAYADELVVPLLAMDFLLCGAFFLAASVGPDSDYPMPIRIDPRYCYPSIYNNRLSDLLVSQRMNARDAEARFGDTFSDQYRILPEALRSTYDYVNVVDYYSAKETATAIIASGNVGRGKNQQEVQQGFFVQGPFQNPIGRIPVAFQKRPTADGRLRGIYSQAKGKMQAQNQFMVYSLMALQQQVNSPIVHKDTNVTEVGVDVRVPIEVMGDLPPNQAITRLPAGNTSPQIPQLIEYLGNEIEKEINYPMQRGGEVNQAIASGKFVDSTMGALTSLVRSVNSAIAAGRQEWNVIAAHLDPNFEKPLLTPYDKKSTYTPGDSSTDGDIWRKGQPETMNRVENPIGAGLDKLNQRVAVIQAQSAGMLSIESGMVALGDVPDVSAELEKIELDQLQRVFMQGALQQPDSPMTLFLAEVITVMKRDGMRLVDAFPIAKAAMAAQAQAAAQQPQPTGGNVTPISAAPSATQAQTEQTALQQGGIPGQADELQGGGAFAPPPLPQVVSNIGRSLQ